MGKILSLHRNWLVLVGLCFTVWQCADPARQQLSFELQRSFRDYVLAVKEVKEDVLKQTVYFPDVADYREHVRNLVLTYLDQAQNKGKVVFDPQGVVLSRLLGLHANRYEVLAVEVSGDGRDATMRAAIRMAYDNNIAYNVKSGDFEKGTRVLIPGKPWGSVISIYIGGEIPIPREQLAYVEFVVDFRKTNSEGVWQVRRCEVDQASLRFETTIRDDFNP